MLQYQFGAAAAIEGLAHQPRTVLLTRQGGPVPIGLPVAFSREPALGMQVVHGGHHGGVRDAALAGKFIEKLTHRSRYRGVAPPYTVHDDCLEFAESSNPHCWSPGYYRAVVSLARAGTATARTRRLQHLRTNIVRP